MSYTKGELKLGHIINLAQIDGKTIFVVMPAHCNTAKEILQVKANGKELIRRWNSQPDLLDNLKMLVALLCHPGSFVSAKDIEKAKAAIAKASKYEE